MFRGSILQVAKIFSISLSVCLYKKAGEISKGKLCTIYEHREGRTMLGIWDQYTIRIFVKVWAI